MKKIGKIGKNNIKARKEISRICEELGWETCEIMLPGCMRTFGVAPAHRHKRIWYKGDWVLLANPKQWIIGCQNCHDKIEDNKKLTEEVFMRLRGKE